MPYKHLIRSGNPGQLLFAGVLLYFDTSFRKEQNMHFRLSYLLFFMMVQILPQGRVLSQEADVPQFILSRERSAYLIGHTRGFGFGYQQGKILNIYSTLFWEVQFATMKHPKEYRRTNESFPNTRTYSYGKLNRIYMLRGGLGLQRIYADKPYWGGVQVRYHFSGGLNLSVAEPMYLYILYYNSSDGKFYRLLEKYDPETHFTDNIYGRGPVGKGLLESKIYPGIYLKGGLSFDYGDQQAMIRSLEVGIAADAFLKTIPIMAFTRNPNPYLTLYLALHIGNRK